MDHTAGPSHAALRYALSLATPHSTDVATPPMAHEQRDEGQPDRQEEEREGQEGDVLGFGTAAIEVGERADDLCEGKGEGTLGPEGALEGGDMSDRPFEAEGEQEQEGMPDEGEKELGEIDQIEHAPTKDDPLDKRRSSGIVPHQQPTIMGPFGKLLTLTSRSANTKMVDFSVYSDSLPGRPPPHRTAYEYRLFLPFGFIGLDLIGPCGFTITEIRKKSRVCVTQVLFTKEDNGGVLILVGSHNSIKSALEIIENHVYRKHWRRWNLWELGKLQSINSDWVKFVPERAAEVAGLWLKPKFSDDESRARQAPLELPPQHVDDSKCRHDRAFPPRPPPSGRRYSHLPPSRQMQSPERPWGSTRSLLAVKEQEGEEPPASYSIDMGDDSALHFFGPNSCAPYIQTTTGSKVTVEASGVHVKVKVEGGDVQRALEKVREVVAATGGKIGGVAADQKEGAKVVSLPVKPDVSPVPPKKPRYSSATSRSHDSPEASISSPQTADTSFGIEKDMNWVAREADLKEQVVKRIKERETSTSGSVTPVEEPARWRDDVRRPYCDEETVQH
ncbi:hypothetical protein Rt10032_c13g5066 [Rhodotorula toruloides]|uniref:K Homology domain-containing protein n=1 Tax=Rhodotorula toruloides TaxID=5286 RepID=A0A511KKZ7_RHOTO|nr:hypothetical protein Rt10032_c13g5066 [Rhodotorula toruloides]